jgi:hypothetical protein
MLSARIAPHRAPNDDRAITQAIVLLKRPQGSAPFLVGLRNDDGQLYREVVCFEDDDVATLALHLRPFRYLLEAVPAEHRDARMQHVFSRHPLPQPA